MTGLALPFAQFDLGRIEPVVLEDVQPLHGAIVSQEKMQNVSR